MKVLMLEPGGWGGISHYAYNLSQALCKLGTRVTLLTAADYELREMPRAFELLSVLDPGGPYPRSVASIARALRRKRPDILHVQATVSARRDWVWLPILRLKGLPSVITAHNILPHEKREREALGMVCAHRLLYSLCDSLIVHSEAGRRELFRLFDVPATRVAVMPHGDYTFAHARVDRLEARRRLGLDEEDRVVLCFGTIREYKGIQHLIPAFGKALAAVPRARLVIAGKPINVNLDDYRRAIDRAGIKDVVRLEARYIPMEEIPVYFSAADLVALPYVHVYQSGALQLAYAYACPVVVTAVGALPESVLDGVNGKVVPPADSEALAAALVYMLSQPREALVKMGHHSRELAESRHGWAAVAEKTLSLYRKISPRDGSEQAVGHIEKLTLR